MLGYLSILLLVFVVSILGFNLNKYELSHYINKTRKILKRKTNKFRRSKIGSYRYK